MKHAFFTLILGLGFAAGAPAAPVFVDGAWLEKRLTNSKIVIVDMSEDDNQYLRFHLPGAVRLPYDVLVKERKNDKVKVRLDDAELGRVLGRLGVTRDSQVVIYDDMGGLNAARLFWELERIGHREASVLDGGLVQWILDGRKVVNTPVKRAPTTYQAAAGGRVNEATLVDVRETVDKRAALLLDVRTEEEYVGESKKPRTGHIPGARFWPWDLAVDFDRGFVRRDDAALKKSLGQVGADPNVPVIAYCRSGHRAAHAYLTLRNLGYENVKVYANSMNEYAATRDAPLKQGRVP
ncbi:MAG: rhodanese-like domain-containing protein [Pseudomonadota bacterium]